MDNRPNFPTRQLPSHKADEFIIHARHPAAIYVRQHDYLRRTIGKQQLQ
jgi:hypothetical protein